MDTFNKFSISISGNLIRCPDLLIKKSKLLEQMCFFGENTSEFIELPEFITKEAISDIVKLVKSLDFESLLTFDVPNLLVLFETSDFLDVDELTNSLMNIIIDKISSENCFEVFKMSRTSACFTKITIASLEVISELLRPYYVNLPRSEGYEDPYYETYKLLTCTEMKCIISFMQSSLTVCKISLFQNWLKANKNISLEEATDILTMINVEACYIPRIEIKYMRQIRDSILTELNSRINL